MKKMLDEVRRLAAQPVAQSVAAQEIVTQARELSEAELVGVTGGLAKTVVA